MEKLIKTIKNFKIIPNNFKSSGEFELLEANEESIKAKLLLVDKEELEDYTPNSTVEVFGVNDVGLVYFETKILSRKKDIIELATTQDFSIIQRREYSRVELRQGNIIFKDMPSNIVQKVEDISAGGLKIITNQPLELDKAYDIEIALSANMVISCALKPTRIVTKKNSNEQEYLISGKFINLENVDRIVLVQYAFKIKMEEENKGNN